jgi:hypothetical protein
MPTGAVRTPSFFCRPQGPTLLGANIAMPLLLPVCGVGGVTRGTAAASDRLSQATHRSWNRTISILKQASG